MTPPTAQLSPVELAAPAEPLPPPRLPPAPPPHRLGSAGGAGRLHQRIEPSRGWRALDLREMWRNRELLRTLAARDIKVRYKQTILGVIYVVFQPLVQTLIFTVVFGRIARIEAPGGVPLPLFIFAAITGFSLFTQTFTRSSMSLLQNVSLVSKVYFPRALLPLSSAISSLLDWLVALTVFAGLWGLLALTLPETMNVPAPGASLLMWPVCTALLVMAAMGVGMAATAMSVSFRDVGHIVPVVANLLLYASPVMYDLREIEALPSWGQVLYLANPLAGLISAYRWSLLGEGTVLWGAFAYSATAAIGLFILGLFVFRRMERRFADVI